MTPRNSVHRSPVRIAQHDFLRLMRQLERRSLHRREAGAFLLAQPGNETVTSIAYYDDLDPHCLTGGITFHAPGYSALNQLCRREKVEVVADIHLHPGDGVRQSDIDAAHPMVARRGHLALIAPQFGDRVLYADQLGAHLKTADGWTTYLGPDVLDVFVVRPTVRGRLMSLATLIRQEPSRR